MSDERVKKLQTPGPRRPRISQAAEVALRVIRRAAEQHTAGFEDRVLCRISTGLRALDDLRGIWWGLTVVHGGERFLHSAHVSLAARIAVETAQSGSPVLWLSVDGNEETPAFRLLTGLARVPIRDVFVGRRLGPAQWEALEGVRARLSSVPLRIGDAHGLTLEELRASCIEAAQTERLALLVVDGVRGFDAPFLTWLERLSQEMDVPVLAVVTSPDGRRDEAERFAEGLPCPLIRGSALLHVRRGAAVHDGGRSAQVPLFVDVLRVGEPDVETVELELDPACRWVG